MKHFARKNIMLASFPFRKRQDSIRREPIKSSSIEFIGYPMPPHKQIGGIN